MDASDVTGTLDLRVRHRQLDDRLTLDLMYCADLCNPSSVKRLAGRRRNVPPSVVADPGVESPSPAERESLAAEWNATTMDHPVDAGAPFSAEHRSSVWEVQRTWIEALVAEECVAQTSRLSFDMSAVECRSALTSGSRLAVCAGVASVVVAREGVVLEASVSRGWCARVLPEFMVPGRFVFWDSSPLTPHGKVDRHRLPVPDGRPWPCAPLTRPQHGSAAGPDG